MPAAHSIRSSVREEKRCGLLSHPCYACTDRITRNNPRKPAEATREYRQKENCSPGARQLLHSDYWLNVSPDNNPILHRHLRRSKRRLEHKKTLANQSSEGGIKTGTLGGASNRRCHIPPRVRLKPATHARFCKIITSVCLPIAIIFAVTQSLSAAPIKFEYSGKVKYVYVLNGADTLGFSVGDTVSGSFIFDPTGPDQYPQPNLAFYTFSIQMMKFGAISVQPPPVNYSYFSIDVNSFPNPDRQAYIDIQAYFESRYDVFECDFYNSDPQPLWGNDQVDLTSVNLDDFDQSDFVYERATFLPDGSVQVLQVYANFTGGEVSSIPEPLPVPEPSTLALLGIGIVGLIGFVRRRHQ